MSGYIAGLNAAVAVENEQRRALGNDRAREAAQSARSRLTPLTERLERLLATIPANVQADGLSLATLQCSLRGRWRGKCHPGDLGAALRTMGFLRRRQWAHGAGFRATWFPPASSGGTRVPSEGRRAVVP